MRRTQEVSAIAVALAALVGAGVAAAPPVDAATRKPAVQLLDSLPVSATSPDGYDRALFRHWTTSNGCSTRQVVLIDERREGTVRGCSVADGAWISAYDDVQVTNSRSLDIDHMVPLKEAWVSGAWRWTPNTRTTYANDLGYAMSLLAVTASTNRSKGDRDPAQWLPAANRCAYAKGWVGVKYRWRLSVDPAEKSALQRVLRTCSPLMVVPPLADRQTQEVADPPGETATGDPEPAPAAGPSGLDPRFDTCGEANAAGYGPYTRGQDPEYEWYIDRDRDGVACER